MIICYYATSTDQCYYFQENAIGKLPLIIYTDQRMYILYMSLTEEEYPNTSLITSLQGGNTCPLVMHGSIPPVTMPPPGNPRDKSGPLGPGVGNCPKRSVSRE